MRHFGEAERIEQWVVTRWRGRPDWLLPICIVAMASLIAVVFFGAPLI